MKRYILKRIGLMVISTFIIMTMLFILIRLLPNPIVSTAGGYEESTARMREAWGYDKPLLIQYGIFLKKVFNHLQ